MSKNFRLAVRPPGDRAAGCRQTARVRRGHRVLSPICPRPTPGLCALRSVPVASARFGPGPSTTTIDPVTVGCQLRQSMADQDDDLALAGQSVHPLEHLSGLGLGQRRVRFVEQEHVRRSWPRPWRFLSVAGAPAAGHRLRTSANRARPTSRQHRLGSRRTTSGHRAACPLRRRRECSPRR